MLIRKFLSINMLGIRIKYGERGMSYFMNEKKTINFQYLDYDVNVNTL